MKRSQVLKVETLTALIICTQSIDQVCIVIAADTGVEEDDSDFWNSLDEFTYNMFDDESYEGSQSSPTLLVAGTDDFPPLYAPDDVFSPLPSTSSDPSFIPMPSSSLTQSQQEIPIPPDISPLLRSSLCMSSEPAASRVPTPPDITPLLKGALSSANVQLPATSAQPSSVSLLQVLVACKQMQLFRLQPNRVRVAA